MANDKAKADLATAGVGYSLAAGGAGVSELGIRHLKQATGLKDLHHSPLRAMWNARKVPGTHKAKALYGGGRLVTALGTAGAVRGSTKYFQDRNKPQPMIKALGDPATVLARHAGDAYAEARNALSNASVARQLARDPKYAHSKASQYDKYNLYRRTARDHKRAGLALTASRRRLSKSLTAPPPVAPEHHSLLMEGLQGQVDAVKDRIQPPKRKASPLKAHAISLGLGAFGGAAGGKVASRYGAKLPMQAVASAAGASASVPVANKINSHFKVKPRRKAVRPSTKASMVEARRSKGADPRAARAAIVPVTKMDDPSEVHVIGNLQVTGKKRPRQLTPYEVAHRRGKVNKLATGMTPAEARRQLNRKKRKLVADVASTGLGIGGLALLGASHPASGLKAVHRAKLARAAGTTAVLGGGVGAVNAIQGIGIAHHDIKAQQKVLKSAGALGLVDDIPAVTTAIGDVVKPKKTKKGTLVPTAPLPKPAVVVDPALPVTKAFGVPRLPGFRSSYLQTRRLRNGTLKATRVNGGVTR